MLKPYWQDSSVTLYLGDSKEFIAELPDGCADMIFTDPPYGHNNNNGDLIHNWEKALGKGNPGESRPIAEDGAEEAGLLARLLFEQSPRLLRAGGCCCCCCCCGGGGPDPQFARWSLWMDEHLEFKQMIPWDKGGLGMGWHYRRCYETVLVGQKPGGPCKWYGDAMVPNIIREGQIPKILPSSNHHPTEKPEALPAWFIALHSQPGDTILDPFAGAGSTLVAAKRMGRKAIGIEIDARWADMAIQRLGQGSLWEIAE